MATKSKIEIEKIHDHPIYPVLKATNQQGHEFFIHCERDHCYRVFKTKENLEEMLKWGFDKTALVIVDTKTQAIKFIEGLTEPKVKKKPVTRKTKS